MLRSMSSFWYVYVLASGALRRTYVGVALDPARRLAQHNGLRPGGAKSTRAGRPWQLAALYGPYACRGDAQRAERLVKALPATERLGLLVAPAEVSV